ncbi:ABC-F family ATP-binding cassette domain-containing protein [Thiomonas sp. FB-Cd]|uniref:ABC-F family ATP-binding cassette domain-containing protein n=1 Tax=Thiomonas sp. FB-Cd TaxID=1158292 RepID=UPI0004DF7E9A|nr:ATP-binding cassette domain-containing protein [Thiomonas sp. FB-Cd]
MIRLQSVTLRRASKVVLDAADLTIQPGEKVGLVGANGAGKSSLFALLLGHLHEDGGSLAFPAHWRVAAVAQDAPDSTLAATDFVCQADTVLQGAIAAMHDAEVKRDGMLLAAAAEAMELADGYTANARAEALLLGLGFAPHELRRPVHDFSGGWRMRLALAQALFQPSDCMLLDEPTNHLDLDALVWLENWLSRYPGTLLIISHDREFLDAATRVTVQLEQGKLQRFAGGYTAFEERRAQAMQQQAQAYARQQQDIAHLTSFVERFRAKATKARQAQSRLKALERMERLAPVMLSNPLRFDFLPPVRQPQQLLRLRGADCGYSAGQPILHGVERDIIAGARIGVLGANGQGKSTLVKTLAGLLPALAGRVQPGVDVVVGYYAQQEMDVLRPDESPLQHLARLAKQTQPQTTTQDWRNWLGRFQFSGDMAEQHVGSMSGGEKARLLLALLVWQRPNVLLLDEPTNHLDLATREALTLALQEFGGAMLLVSHDRALLRAACDEYWLVADGQVKTFEGDLDDYQRWVLERARTRMREGAQSAGDAGAAGAAAGSASANSTRKEQRRSAAQSRQNLAQQAKPLKAEQAALESELGALEAERAALEMSLAQSATPAAQRVEQGKRLKLVAERIASYEQRWLDLAESIETLQV